MVLILMLRVLPLSVTVMALDAYKQREQIVQVEAGHLRGLTWRGVNPQDFKVDDEVDHAVSLILKDDGDGDIDDIRVKAPASHDIEADKDSKAMHGVLLCLFASCLSSLGVVVQKYAHNKTLEDAAFQSTPGAQVDVNNWSFYFKGWWIGGFSIWISAQLMNMFAMGLAPQTMLSCFGSVTVICNVLFARLILGELISSGEGLGLLGIFMGVIFVIIGAPHTFIFVGNARWLVSQFASPSFIILSVLVAAAMVMLYRYLCEKDSPVVRIGLFWAICSAVVSGYSALLFKCISLMILHASAYKPYPWHSPDFWIIFCLAVGVGLLEIHTLNMGLKNCQAVVLVPVYLSLGMIAQIITNGVFFKEFSQFESKVQIGLFLVGVALSVIFVAAVFIIRATLPSVPTGQEVPDDAIVLKKVQKKLSETGDKWQTTSDRTSL